MSRSRTRTMGAMAAALAVAGLAACSQDVSAPEGSDASFALAGAFSRAPAAFNEVTSSFAGDGSLAFAGERGGRGPDRDGRDAGGIGGGFMGGGLGDAFHGGPGFGRGHERGPFRSGLDASCTFASAGGDVTCGPTSRNGLTITRVYTFRNSAGVAQATPDSTTNSERARITVSGTFSSTRRDSVTTTVQHSSDRTVTGLASGATQRTVNGTATGTESTSGINRDDVQFTSVRVSGDTTQGLVIPITATGRSYPTAGTVRREMKVTVTLAGGAPTVTTRREVVTYNGTATATVVITTNGTVRRCTLPLPRGRLVCGA
jgi:hypothetical protein